MDRGVEEAFGGVEEGLDLRLIRDVGADDGSSREGRGGVDVGGQRIGGE